MCQQSCQVGRRMVKIFQMEDMSLSLFPFLERQDLALFVIADGHGGKDAAAAAVEFFPAVAKELLLEQSKGESSENSVQFAESVAVPIAPGEISMENLFRGVESHMRNANERNLSEGGWNADRFDCEGISTPQKK
jgi:serine/threonine protein phosphatase PrpC